MLWIIPLDQLYLKQVYAIMAIFPLHIKDQGDYGVSFVAPPQISFYTKASPTLENSTPIRTFKLIHANSSTFHNILDVCYLGKK